MKVDSENRDVPRLSWDYMYMKEKQEKERPDVVSGEGMPIVVTKDSSSKGIVAFEVPNKGMCEYAINKAENVVNNVLGYKKMIFKSDQMLFSVLRNLRLYYQSIRQF